MKTFKDMPNRTFIFFSVHCIVLFPLRTSGSWRSAKCTWRLFKVWSHWPNSKLICYSERGEPRLSFGYKFCRPYLFFSSHSIVLFPQRTPASWRSAKCTRRVLKVWSHWPNSKLMCYSERGAPMLLFEYKFFDLPWKLLKIYPTVHSYFFFSWYSIVLFPLRTSAS